MATLRTRRQHSAGRIGVGYVRMSTSKQDLSPGVQGAALDRWAADNGVDLVAVYFDLGVSGGLPEIADRPGLASALGSLRKHGASVFLAAKRDRFARDVWVSAEIQRRVEKLGAGTFSADGRGNGEGDDAAFDRELDSVLSARERRVIARRTRDALAIKRARGERLGCLPYGHRLAADGLHTEADPAEQAVIARGKALSDTGLSIRAIAAQLAHEGIVGRTGNPLSHTQVHRFLRPLLLAEAA